jgi:23S rRNA (guanosine2251-2'-O)-methyltransferase
MHRDGRPPCAVSRRRTGTGEGATDHADARRSEVVVGRRAALEAVRAGRASEVLVVSGARETPAMRELAAAAAASRVELRRVPRARLDRLAEDHHGVIARVRVSATLTERDLANWAFGEDALVVLLDGISDPQNLGAAARSAEAAGAAMLVTRTRRAAPVTPSAVRASAGALLHLPHVRVPNIVRAIDRLKGMGFFVVGLDERAGSTVFDDPCPAGRVCLVLGSEGAGLSRLVRETCDALVRLPMGGRVSSLNASAALAAVLYAYVLPSRHAPRA